MAYSLISYRGTLNIFKIWIFCIFKYLSSKMLFSQKELGQNHFGMKWEQFSQTVLSTSLIQHSSLWSNETQHNPA